MQINVHEIINEKVELTGINIVNMQLNIYVRSNSIIIGIVNVLIRFILNVTSLYMDM